MIRLFEATETEFVTQGLGVLSDATTCTVTEERNGQYELSMQYPIRGQHYHDLGYDKIIFCKPNPYSDPQAFQIYKITNGLHGTAHIYAEHISYRLSKITVAPFSADTCQLALVGLKEHATEECPFEFSTDKEISSPYNQTKPATIRQRLGGDQDSILAKYKGEYEWDNFRVILWTNRGSNIGLTVRYGKNLTDFNQEKNIQDTYTAVFPYYHGSSEDEEDILVILDGDPIVRSENVDRFAIKKTVPLDLTDKFEDVPTQEELRQEALRYIADNDVGVPKVSIKFNFVELRNTPEYANVAPLEEVRLCDTVTVEYDELDVSATAKVVKTTYNVLTDRYDSIEIGDAKSGIANTVVSTIGSISTEVDSSATAVQKEIKRLMSVFAGAYGGHLIIDVNANGQPNQMFIIDSENMESAQKILWLSQAGIAMSSSGWNNFNSVWDLQNGTFNGQNINITNINATNLVAGTIMDATGTNYWNLETGEFVLGALDSETQSNSQAIADLNNILNTYVDNISVSESSIALGQGTTIQQGTISTEKIAVAQTLAVGNHVWLARSNGTNTTLVYVGD